MTLLREVIERPLDPGYAAAAARKYIRATDTPSSGPLKRQWWQEAVVILLTVAIGMGGVWAARQLRTPVEGASNARVLLEHQITDRTALSEQLQSDISDLRSQIGEIQDELDTTASAVNRRRADTASVWAGTIAVEGPGLELVLTDPLNPKTPDARVLDIDIQVIVNALWAAGAEAIAINNHRIAYGTAIRAAGEVVMVDLQPLVSPYSIQVIGNPEDMAARFAGTNAADHLSALNSKFGIKSTLTQHTHLALPAGTSLVLSYAELMKSQPAPVGEVGQP